MPRRPFLVAMVLTILLPARGPAAAPPSRFRPPTAIEYQSRLRLPAGVAKLPESWDWRTDAGDASRVAPARDQRNCGADWALAITGLVESRILVEYAETVAISPQWLLSGDPRGDGCCGGGVEGLTFLMQRGILLEDDLPYAASDAEGSRPCLDEERGEIAKPAIPCPPAPPRPPRWAVADFHACGASPAAIKRALVAEGPLLVWLDAYPDLDGYWRRGRGAYRRDPDLGPDDREGSHAVLLIGYDDARRAWICQNSWGETWGPHRDGSFDVAYDAGCGFTGAYACDVTRLDGVRYREVLRRDGLAGGDTIELAGRSITLAFVRTDTVPPTIGLRAGEGGATVAITAGSFATLPASRLGFRCENIRRDDDAWRVALRGYTVASTGPAASTMVVRGEPGSTATLYLYPGAGGALRSGRPLVVPASGSALEAFDAECAAGGGGSWATVEVPIPDGSPGGEHTVYLNVTGDTAAGDHLIPLTLAVCRSPARPTSLVLEPPPLASGQTVRLSWEAADRADYYRVLHDGVPTGEPVTATAATIEVRAGAWSVLAVNDCGARASAVISLDLDTVPGQPSPPVRADFGQPSPPLAYPETREQPGLISLLIRLEWRALAGAHRASDYEVEYMDADGGLHETIRVPARAGALQGVTLDDVEYLRRYVFRVRTADRLEAPGPWSDWSAVYSFELPDPEP